MNQNLLSKTNHFYLFIAGCAWMIAAGCSKTDKLLPDKTNAPAEFLTVQGPLGSASNPYKIAYYAFDHGGPRITEFSPYANVVVLFEGTPFEMADSVHYTSTGWIFKNPNYPNYAALFRDIKILQAKGVKVLWNIDDAPSWQTSSPFTDYSGKKLSAAQYAALVKACVIDSLHMDGIALDQEHITPYSTEPNSNYLSVLKNLSAYFGLSSSNPSTIFTSATGYDVTYGWRPIQSDKSYAANMNFVMDMGYWQTNQQRITTRLPRFANIAGFGWPKTMTGVDAEQGAQSNLSESILSAQWQPSGTYKAGIMVYAANGDTSYAGKVFRAVSTGKGK